MNYGTREPLPEHADKWDYAHSLGCHQGQRTFTIRVFKWTQRLSGSTKLSFTKSYAHPPYEEFKLPSEVAEKAFFYFDNLCDELNEGQRQCVDRALVLFHIRSMRED